MKSPSPKFSLVERLVSFGTLHFPKSLTQFLARQSTMAFLISLLTFAAGFAILHLNIRIGSLLVRSSYNWNFDLSPFRSYDLENSPVVIVYMDQPSYDHLQQPYDAPWDRHLHAKLLDRLTQDQAKGVIFDILFLDPGDNPDADQTFAEALARNGHVILAADYNLSSQAGNGLQPTLLRSLVLPYSPFLNAAAGWGIASIQPEEDFIVRQHNHEPESDNSSMTWAMAEHLGIVPANSPEFRRKERWLNYYDRPFSIPHVSYHKVLETDSIPKGFFKDKIIIVGARPMATSYIERRDEHRSSFSTLNERFQFMPSVEIHATQLLNLIRGDYLHRLPPALEWGILALVSLLLGFTLIRYRPVLAGFISLLAMETFSITNLILFATHQIWFPWLIVVLIQIPIAFTLSVVYRSLDWYFQRQKLESERLLAESRIREQAALLDKARDAILTMNLLGQPTFWNQGAADLYGWSFNEIQNGKLQDFLSPSTSDKFLKAKEHALLHGEWSGELPQQTKSKASIIVQSRWTLVKDSQNRPHSFLIINTDVSEQKNLETQILRAQRMESIGTLASGIAHDLNNVLSPLLMGVHLLQMHETSPGDHKTLQMMENNIKRGVDIVKQVLTLGRGLGAERAAMKITPVIKEIVKIAQETFPRSIQVTAKCEENLQSILGDTTQIHQVLLNLCVNARDAMPEGGLISIHAKNVTLDEKTSSLYIDSHPGDYVQLQVSDTGSGISPENLERIFEPFFTTKEIGKGTGLGLSTSIKIVKNHGGFIDLKSSLGVGTTFNLFFPATQTAEMKRAESNPITPMGKGELILVVDDEPDIRDLLQTILKDQGYRTLFAVNGADAVATLNQYREEIQLVLIDLMMPVLGGAKAVELMLRTHPNLPYVFMSGMVHKEELENQFRDARIRVISKPFQCQKVIQLIHGELIQPPHPVS